MDQRIAELLTKPKVDRALIASLLGYTIQRPGQALGADIRHPNYELEPSYMGESKYEESYFEIDPEHLDNNKGAPNAMQNQADPSNRQNSRGMTRKTASGSRGRRSRPLALNRLGTREDDACCGSTVSFEPAHG